jgi:tetratricopeptide (TPR) repeat protein
LQKLIAVNPDDIESRADLGDLFLARGDFKNAEAEYSIIKKRAGGLPVGYVKCSGLYLVCGNIDGAIREMTQAVKLNPKSEELFSVLAGLHVRRKQYDKAIALCDARIAMNPGNETVRIFSADIYPRSTISSLNATEKSRSTENWLAANTWHFRSAAPQQESLDEALSWAQKVADEAR